MTTDQTFRKIKKRAKKDSVSSPKTISRKGNRWFLIDTMAGNPGPSRLIARLMEQQAGSPGDGPTDGSQ